MSEYDNGFARAQQAYDQQEPPEPPPCPFCEGLDVKGLAYARERVEEIKRSIQAHRLCQTQHLDNARRLQAEMQKAQTMAEERQQAINKLAWELGLLEMLGAGGE